MSNQFKDVEKVTDILNNFSFKPEEFCEGMKRQHRTLQQSFTRLCLAWIKTCAEGDYLHDERNRASHIKCKAIVNSMEKDPAWDFLPFI